MPNRKAALGGAGDRLVPGQPQALRMEAVRAEVIAAYRGDSRERPATYSQLPERARLRRRGKQTRTEPQEMVLKSRLGMFRTPRPLQVSMPAPAAGVAPGPQPTFPARWSDASLSPGRIQQTSLTYRSRFAPAPGFSGEG